MDCENRPGTMTLARLFADQGHWEKAADIYRSLLHREPGREDIAQALAEAERQMTAATASSARDLVPLFREWIDLLLQGDRLRRLRRLKRSL